MAEGRYKSTTKHKKNTDRERDRLYVSNMTEMYERQIYSVVLKLLGVFLSHVPAHVRACDGESFDPFAVLKAV